MCGMWKKFLQKWGKEADEVHNNWKKFEKGAVDAYADMLTDNGGMFGTLGDDGFAANVTTEEDAAMNENIVRFAEQSSANAADVGDLQGRMAALEMAREQPMGLGLPPKQHTTHPTE